ncbi:MAG TPA: RluA family pseudouridine synthase [candidate division Zixibacteria bacterium]|nr:RluA family pseudouridine synthase [candidate division Zixibacteria bacterium]
MSEQILFPAGEAPKTLENFLKRRFPIGYVRKLLRKHGVRVNGRRARAGDMVEPGDRIEIYIPFEEKPGSKTPASAPAAPLPVIFEDDSLLVIDKPPGLAVHEGRTVLKRESLLGMLEARYRARGIVPRLVHRLDRETSGVLLVAKDEATAERLKEAFERREVEKEYLCLVAGRLPENRGTIDFPLPGRDGRMVRAATFYRVERRFRDTTLVRARIETGRMHQIRLHFAALGHPVVMDRQHGDFAFNRRFRKAYRLDRQFLHASAVALEHKGRRRRWTAPLPPDLQSVVDALAAEGS